MFFGEQVFRGVMCSNFMMDIEARDRIQFRHIGVRLPNIMEGRMTRELLACFMGILRG